MRTHQKMTAWVWRWGKNIAIILLCVYLSLDTMRHFHTIDNAAKAGNLALMLWQLFRMILDVTMIVTVWPYAQFNKGK